MKNRIVSFISYGLLFAFVTHLSSIIVTDSDKDLFSVGAKTVYADIPSGSSSSSSGDPGNCGNMCGTCSGTSEANSCDCGCAGGQDVSPGTTTSSDSSSSDSSSSSSSSSGY